MNNWTDELFDLMLQKLIERKTHKPKPVEAKVKDNILFKQAKNLIEVKKRGD